MYMMLLESSPLLSKVLDSNLMNGVVNILLRCILINELQTVCRVILLIVVISTRFERNMLFKKKFSFSHSIIGKENSYTVFYHAYIPYHTIILFYYYYFYMLELKNN